jgi:hypothetical protein
LIVDEGMVHYARSDLNLTDRVIQEYNQQHPVHGPIVLPDAGTVAPPPPMAMPEASGAPAGGDAAPLTPPPSLGSGADAGSGQLSPVFFRRDAGH